MKKDRLPKHSLKCIKEEKEEVRELIQRQQSVLTGAGRNMLMQDGKSKGNALSRSFSAGLIAVQIIVVGYKAYSRIKKVFGKK